MTQPMRGSTRYRLRCICVGVVAVSLPPIAAGQDAPVEGRSRPSLALSLGTGQTSNITRTPDPVRSDVHSLGVDLGATTMTERIEGRVATNIQYRKFGTSVTDEDDDVLGAFDGALVVQAVPERLSWSFEQNFGQVRTDPLAPSTPDNRGHVKVFSTGPRLSLPVGNRNSLEVSARASERRYDDVAFLDSRYETARIGFDHALDAATRIGVSVDRTRTEIEGAGFSRYEFNVATLAYSREFSSGGVVISVGSGDVEISDQNESTSVARFEWSRDLGARSEMRVYAGRELTDAGELFRLGGLQRGGDALAGFSNTLNVNDDRLNGVVLTSSPLRRSDAGFALDLNARRTRVSIAVSVGEDEFEQNDVYDNSFEMLQVSLSRQLSRSWQASANFSLVTQDFTVLDQDNEDALGRLALSRSLGRQTSLQLSFDRTRRGTGFSIYDEDFYMVSWVYSL